MGTTAGGAFPEAYQPASLGPTGRAGTTSVWPASGGVTSPLDSEGGSLYL